MTTPSTVLLRYFAAAEEAAGTPEEQFPLAEPMSVEQVLGAAGDRHPALRGLLQRCSILVDEVVQHDRTAAVSPGQAIDVLPPFAGG